MHPTNPPTHWPLSFALLQVFILPPCFQRTEPVGSQVEHHPNVNHISKDGQRALGPFINGSSAFIYLRPHGSTGPARLMLRVTVFPIHDASSALQVGIQAGPGTCWGFVLALPLPPPGDT